MKLFAIESNTEEQVNFTSPKELYDWMDKRLYYHGVSKKYLYTPEEVLKNKKAHCWESCSFEYEYLKKLGLKCKIVYLENQNSTVTHTALYYTDEKEDKYYWFEWAWYRNRGIHEYKNIDSLIKDLVDKFVIENIDIGILTEGSTLIKEKTLQKDYYEIMAYKWKKLSHAN